MTCESVYEDKMIMQKRIVPFDDYWADFQRNIIYSLLITFDMDAIIYAYNNDYTYHTIHKTAENGEHFQAFELLYNKCEMEADIFKNIKQLKLKINNKVHLETLKENIKEGKIVLVGIDLFYWIPKSLYYEKYHENHYSVISGYDEKQKVFYVLDENKHGFGQFSIPEEQVQLAITGFNGDTEAIICECNENAFPAAGLTVDSLVDNAQRIINSILRMKDDFFTNSDEQNKFFRLKEWNSMNLLRIQNRQKANIRLFEMLYRNEKLSRMETGILQNVAKSLKGQWELVKSYMKNIEPENIMEKSKGLNDLIQEMLTVEADMWGKFIQSVSSEE